MNEVTIFQIQHPCTQSNIHCFPNYEIIMFFIMKKTSRITTDL